VEVVPLASVVSMSMQVLITTYTRWENSVLGLNTHTNNVTYQKVFESGVCGASLCCLHVLEG